MKIAVNIKVRNPDWNWTGKELLELDKGYSISGDEKETTNGYVIKKHKECVDFEYLFDVVNATTNPKTSFDLVIHTSENKEFVNPTEHNIKLDDVTIVEFEGQSEKSFVVVSNDLIHQFIDSLKDKDDRLYWSFHIKENIPYVKLCDNIWLSDRMIYKHCESMVLKANCDLFFKVCNEKLIDKNLKKRELNS